MFDLLAWVISVILLVLGAIGLPGLFILMAMESFGLPPFPGELVLAFAGVLIAMGHPYFDWGTVLTVGVAGSVTGSYSAYEVARWGGPKLLHRWGARLGIGRDEIEAAHRFFERRGEPTVFFSRMVPLVRGYISYPAGSARMDRTRFFVYTVLGTIPFTVLMVYLGVLLGENYTVLSGYFDLAEVVVAIGLAGLLGYYLLRRHRRTRAVLPPDLEGEPLEPAPPA
jgi:membrane protein DedA with SNARE-associated domain